MLKAIKQLDLKMTQEGKLLVGGGSALVLAHDFPLATLDIDAIFYKSPIQISDIHEELQKVATDLDLPKDWINPYFEAFLFALPQDYMDRIKTVFKGRHLVVNALGLEDLLVLKCFAGRPKDLPHARALLKKGADVNFVEKHLFDLIDKNVPGAKAARDFLDELREEVVS